MYNYMSFTFTIVRKAAPAFYCKIYNATMADVIYDKNSNL